VVKQKFLALLITTFFIVFILIVPPDADAAKKRVRAKSTSTAVSYSSAKLLRPKNSVLLTLKNLTNVTKVSYELTYTVNGKEEGAGGSIVLSGQVSESRELYFGTCSHGVCTPHANIKNATLTVSTILKSEKRHTKLYKIKL